MLKSAYSEADLHVLCKPFVSNLIAVDPAIDKVITNIEDWKQRYYVVVELRGTWQTLHNSLTLRTKFKYRFYRGWVRFLQRGAQPHEVVTNERIIRPLVGDDFAIAKRVFYPSVAEVAEGQICADWALNDADCPGYAILHTGARRELRRWPLECFVALSKWLLSEKNLIPIWVGTANEESQLDEAFAMGAASCNGPLSLPTYKFDDSTKA